MPEEVGERGYERRHIGPRGCVEHALHSQRLLAGGDEAGVGEHGFGAAGGVEFDGQGDEVEEHDHRPGQRHDQRAGEGLDQAGEQAQQGEPHDDLAGIAGDAHSGHAPVERLVRRGVLDCMAALVGGHAQGGRGAAEEVVGREHETSVDGIVMVAQQAVGVGDFDTVDAEAAEDSLCDLAAGEARAHDALAVAVVHRFDARCGPERQRHCADEQYPDHSLYLHTAAEAGIAGCAPAAAFTAGRCVGLVRVATTPFRMDASVNPKQCCRAMEWLNYHHLRYFYVTAKEGSLARAAARLHVSQPSISEQIRELEAALGERLFRREGRGNTLTDVGHLVFGYAEEIFGLGRELMSAVQQRPGMRVLRFYVGVADSFPKLVTNEVLKPVFAMAQTVHVICREGKIEDLLVQLAGHRLDIVLADEPAAGANRGRVYSHPLDETGITFCAGKELALTLKRGFPGSLDGAPALLPAENTSLRRALDRWLMEERIRPRVLAEFEDLALMKVMAAEGLGFIAVPSIAVQDAVGHYGFQVIGEVAECRVQFYAITAERRIAHPAVGLITRRVRDSGFQTGGGALGSGCGHARHDDSDGAAGQEGVACAGPALDCGQERVSRSDGVCAGAERGAGARSQRAGRRGGPERRAFGGAAGSLATGRQAGGGHGAGVAGSGGPAGSGGARAG